MATGGLTGNPIQAHAIPNAGMRNTKTEAAPRASRRLEPNQFRSQANIGDGQGIREKGNGRNHERSRNETLRPESGRTMSKNLR